MPKEDKQKMKGAWRTTWKNRGKIYQKYVEGNKRKQWVNKCWRRWCGNETIKEEVEVPLMMLMLTMMLMMNRIKLLDPDKTHVA